MGQARPLPMSGGQALLVDLRREHAQNRLVTRVTGTGVVPHHLVEPVARGGGCGPLGIGRTAAGMEAATVSVWESSGAVMASPTRTSIPQSILQNRHS